MAAPQAGELATTASDPFVPQFQTVMQPSDETLIANGGVRSYRIYDEIRRDPHAHAILQKRKLEVISREWQVVAVSDRRNDKKIAADIERLLKSVSFDQLTRGLLGAILKGFAVAEIIWTRNGGIWTPSAIKVKKQNRFRFDVNGGLRMLTRSAPVEGVAVPDRKFIVHRHSIDDDDDDPYGVGLGSVLFWPAWFKRQVLANWLQATRKHAAPTTLAQYQGAFDKAKQDLLAEALMAMQASDSLIVPENVKVELLEAKGSNVQSEELARYLDELMSEAVLGETLTTNSGERGARSLGDIHNEIRIAIAKADADLVCKTIQQSLLRWYVEINYPGEAVPEVWRDFSEAEDLNDKVERDKKIYEMGYRPASVDYINETYGGEWIERETTQPPAGKDQQPGNATAGLAFADPVRPEAASQQTVRQISDQMAEFGRPAIDAMIGEIRSAFTDAISYDDLIERLARLSGDLSIEELAQMMAQGSVLADLEGRASADG
jgi:phage gp29-like protein